MERAKIGVGIVTYKRPDYFKVALESVQRVLGDVVDEIVTYHDGPLVKGYDKSVPHGKNMGVAHAKNQVIQQLLDRGCEYNFVMEDDMEILDRKAVVAYIAAYRMTGVPHLNFHAHGDNLYGRALEERGPLAFWPNAVGSWSFYTRHALETVGLMDENFVNAYEHVEHSWRIYKDRITYGFWPDVIGSEYWIRAQDGALENSAIRDPGGKWQKRISDALAYWRSKDPECPALDPNWMAIR